MSKIFLKRLLIIISLCLIMPTTIQARATLTNYNEAFQAIDRKRINLVKNFVFKGNNPILNKVLHAELMALPGNNYSFNDLASFIIENPDWPNKKGIIMIAEQKIPSFYSNSQIIDWFKKSPPLSLNGLKRYVSSLKKAKRLQDAADHVRSWWINRDFSRGEYKYYYKRFKGNLRSVDHKKRISRLIWQRKFKNARKMYHFLDKKNKALMMARVALAKNLRKATKYLRAVPNKLLNDEGLIYERLHWRQKHNINNGAIELLNSQPEKITHPKKWWKERHVIVRRLMEKGHFNKAYEIASNHGIKKDAGFPYLQAEFISGFLALRKINNQKQALQHFLNIRYVAKTPISTARADYWIGRSYEALNNSSSANDSYKNASLLFTTYYGQMALARLKKDPTIYARPESTVSRDLLNKFHKEDITQSIIQLDAIGQERRAEKFYVASLNKSSERTDFALLLKLAYELHRPDWAVKAAKTANKKNVIISGSAFPVLAMKIPVPPELALTHALIRQESEFKSKAGSHMGAQGLMQLMPSTARSIARRLGIRYSKRALADPSYNILLGTSFIQNQIDKFDGSYVLALASYNAGASRVRKWIKLFGDPRDPYIDAIDWIELIPIYETRNYIMRIIENIQFYRARLNKGKAPLMILSDIKR